MPTAIGDLVVNLGMNPRKFIAGTQSVLRRSKAMAVGVAKHMAKVTAVVSGGALVAGTALVAMAKRTSAAMDATGKLADQLGIGIDQLQGFRHAAELTGAGAGKLDAGLQTLAKRLGEAEYKGSAADKAMQRLGLGADKLANMPLADAFELIADKMGDVESQSVKNAIAANFFSKANMGLLKTLTLGKAGLAEARAEAEGLGLAFSKADHARVAELSDAWYRVSAAVTGVVQKITINLAPAMTAAAEAMRLFITEGQTNMAGLTTSWDGLFAAVDNVAWAMKRALILQLQMKAMSLAKTRTAMQMAGYPTSKINEASKAYGAVLRKIRELESSDWSKKIRDKYEEVKNAAVETKKATGSMADVLGGWSATAAAKINPWLDWARQLSTTQDAAVAGATAGQSAPSVRLAGAAERGSAEALSTINRAGAEQDKTAKAHLKVGKMTLDEIKGMRRDSKTPDTVSIPTA